MHQQVKSAHFELVFTSLSLFATCIYQVVPFSRTSEPYGSATWSWGEGWRFEDINIYYYTPIPLNLANKQATSKQASTQQATSISPFDSCRCSASSLRALLYSSHPRAQVVPLPNPSSEPTTHLWNPGARSAKSGGALRKLRNLCPTTAFFWPQKAPKPSQNGQTKANGSYTTRAPRLPDDQEPFLAI